MASKRSKDESPRRRRKSGSTGTRLAYTSAPNAEIRERQRKARQPGPVTVRFVDPATLKR